MTRIPRMPNRGKENLRGARVVKPVGRPRLATEREDGILTTSSKENTLTTISRPADKSNIFISSKTVPDLHNKILAKIRLHKRRSKNKNITPNQSPCKAPAPTLELSQAILSSIEDPENSDRESPVSGQELETYLASMFFKVDSYRTGLVSAGSLLEYLGSLVDLPRLDKWKLEELSRMLDPNKDNRYVDKELWSEVGQAWVEMMMDPDNHSDTSCGESEEAAKELGDDFEHEEIPVNISYGSIEGVGGPPGCSSREVELENKVSELKYQLARIVEEKRELVRNLAASEDLGQSLSTELEGNMRQIVTLSTSINKGEMFFEEVKQARETEEECCNLAQKVQELTKEVNEKEDKMGDMEVMMVTIRGESDEYKEREELVQLKLNEAIKKCECLEEELKKKKEQVKREIDAREEVEGRLERTQLEVQRLEMEMSVKDEEIRNLTETGSRVGSLGSSAGSSMIHDVSVDDRVIEENLRSQASPAPVFTPGKLPLQSPIRRGPSASSTPNKVRLGSIADELKEMDSNNDFLSPFCEKKGSGLKKDVLSLVDRLVETVRKIIVDQVEPGRSNKLAMTILNKDFLTVRKVVDEMLDEFPSKDELVKIKENTAELEEKLADAKAEIENMKKDKDSKESDDDLLDGAEQVSVCVDAVASLLQTANSALLAVTEDSSVVVPDCSVEAETDLSNWQLDLEGIQLVEWNTQLSRKLIHYTKCGKKNPLAELSSNLKSPFPTELSKSPVPGTRLWQSLYNRLEELQKASEISRDLLMMAGDSIREKSINQSTSIMFPKTVSCQTDTLVQQSKICQTSPINTSKTVSQYCQTEVALAPPSSTHLATTCQVENCFCSNSQARSSSSRWRSAMSVIGSMVLLLLLFTFLCGLEIDHSVYYPITWHPLRMALGDWLPHPLITMSYQTVGTRTTW